MPRKIESPCVDICTLDHANNICIGCLRSIDEIVAWASYTDEQRRQIMTDLPGRKERRVG
jgi:predicted Fe-S protein YdhL (DUF1289 family)